MNQDHCNIPLFDTTLIHTKEAVDWALNKNTYKNKYLPHKYLPKFIQALVDNEDVFTINPYMLTIQ